MKKHSIKSRGIAFLLKCGKKQNWAIDKKVEFTKKKDKIISECYCTYTSGRMKFFCLQIGGTKPQNSKKYYLSCSMQKWIWLAGNWNIFHLQLFLEMQRWQLAAAFVFQTWVIISDMHQRSWECHNILTFLWFYLQTLISNLISMWYVLFSKILQCTYQQPTISVAHLKVLAETLTFW